MKRCRVCGTVYGIEGAHITAKGMGGRGKKAPADAHDRLNLCAGSGGNTDNTSCHGADHAGVLIIDNDRFMVPSTFRTPDSERVAGRFIAALNSRRTGRYVEQGVWYPCLPPEVDFDAVDCEREELIR